MRLGNEEKFFIFEVPFGDIDKVVSLICREAMFPNPSRLRKATFLFYILPSSVLNITVSI
jgi:hypothetical protein